MKNNRQLLRVKCCDRFIICKQVIREKCSICCTSPSALCV